MANISVRNLENKVYEQLRLRAARHGHSMEEEARQIISVTVSAPERLTTIFQQYFGKENGVDLDTLPRDPHDPMDFGK